MTNKAREFAITKAVKIADTKANLKQSILDNDTKRICKVCQTTDAFGGVEKWLNK